MCFLVLDFGLNIVLSLTCPESLPWHCSEFYFLALNFCLDIISSVLPCLGSFLWHCLKFASLSWIFTLVLFQVCFLVLDLCLNIISNVLPCPEIWLWHCSESYLSWIFTLTLSQVCFLVLDLCLNIVLSLAFLSWWRLFFFQYYKNIVPRWNNDHCH
jgi:hypothetical protein